MAKGVLKRKIELLEEELFNAITAEFPYLATEEGTIIPLSDAMRHFMDASKEIHCARGNLVQILNSYSKQILQALDDAQGDVDSVSDNISASDVAKWLAGLKNAVTSGDTVKARSLFLDGSLDTSITFSVEEWAQLKDDADRLSDIEKECIAFRMIFIDVIDKGRNEESGLLDCEIFHAVNESGFNDKILFNDGSKVKAIDVLSEFKERVVGIMHNFSELNNKYRETLYIPELKDPSWINAIQRLCEHVTEAGIDQKAAELRNLYKSQARQLAAAERSR